MAYIDEKNAYTKPLVGRDVRCLKRSIEENEKLIAEAWELAMREVNRIGGKVDVQFLHRLHDFIWWNNMALHEQMTSTPGNYGNTGKMLEWYGDYFEAKIKEFR